MVEMEEPLLHNADARLGQDLKCTFVMEGLSIVLNNEQHTSDAMSMEVGIVKK